MDEEPARVFALNDAGEIVRDAEGDPVTPNEAGPICLAAVADLDGTPGIVGDGTGDDTGDEDSDGFSDLTEACVLMTDPCVFDPGQDSDGIPDAVDNRPSDANRDQSDGDGVGDGCA